MAVREGVEGDRDEWMVTAQARGKTAWWVGCGEGFVMDLGATPDDPGNQYQTKSMHDRGVGVGGWGGRRGVAGERDRNRETQRERERRAGKAGGTRSSWQVHGRLVPGRGGGGGGGLVISRQTGGGGGGRRGRGVCT